MSLFFGLNLSAMSAKSVGSVWQPKASRLSVGRELSPLSATCFSGEDRKIVTARGDDTRFMSNDLFKTAKSVAAMGLKTRHFRSVNTEDFTYSSLARQKLVANPEAHRKTGMSNFSLATDSDSGELLRHGNYKVTFDGSEISVWEKDPEGNFSILATKQTVRSDTRLSWDENGNPVFTTGSAALKGNKLAADGADNVLIRKSGADVVAGDGTVVVNLSKDKGKFAGGSNVTYLGAYAASAIEGGEGKTTFAGYFEKMESLSTKGQGVYSGVFEELSLEGSETSDTYSGYFANVSINAGKGHNTFSGLFMGGSAVTGGDDGNAFNGRFIDSTLKGGSGDDKVGRHVNLAGQGRVVTESGDEYTGLAADIINSIVDTGEGDDTVTAVSWKSDIRLNDGDNKISGIYTESSVKAGAGNDLLAVMFSNASSFDLGDGADSAAIGTAMGTTVRTGEGSAAIVMGNNKNKDKAVEGGSLMNGDAALASTSFQTYDQRRNNITGMEYGELSGNNVVAETGENLIRVHTGEGTETIRTGSRNTDEAKSGTPEESPASEEPREASAETTKELASQAAAMDAARRELSIIEDVTGTVLQSQQPAQRSSGGTKKMRGVLERYARQSGPGAVVGSTGVSVSTGAGETLAVRTFDRSYSAGRPEPQGVLRTTRRATGLGAFEWDISST